MQRDNLTYEWNDMALLTDQRAYTIICKTMLKIPLAFTPGAGERLELKNSPSFLPSGVALVFSPNHL